MLKVLNESYLELEFVSEQLRNDKEFILEALKNNPYLGLEFVSEQLRNDKEVVLEAVVNLEFAS